MGSRVYFLDFKKCEDVLEGIDMLLNSVLRGEKLQGKRVAVKAHFGEMGNYTHIRPAFVRRAVDYLKAAGAEPFATDTTTLYPSGGRLTVEEGLKTAAYNGFTEAGLGCPLAIADGPDGYSGVEYMMGKDEGRVDLKVTKVAKRIAEADAMVVLSHVKGHGMTGMGGAIKNLGMGCTTRDCKSAQHSLHGCEFIRDPCLGCGTCVRTCHFGALTMEGGYPVKNEKCVYCLNCMFNCENGAIKLLPGGKEKFQEGLARAGAAVMRTMEGKAVVFLNFIFDVTPQCDCASPSGGLVVQNVGILASRDPVAIDRASMDLVDGAPMVAGWKETPPDLLGKINGTHSTGHMEAAERYALGNLTYELVTIG